MVAFARQTALDVHETTLFLFCAGVNPNDDAPVPQLATELFNELSRPGPTFISALDDHINFALPASTSSTSSLNRGDVLEIQGPPSSGKTSLLYFLAMTCVLPYSCSIAYEGRIFEVVLGGRTKASIVCDCDGSWCSERLRTIIMAYVSARVRNTIQEDSNGTISDDITKHISPSVSDISHEALAYVHVFRPSSSLSFAATLASLPNYHAMSMPEQEIGMLMIDSWSAFHWPDAWRRDIIANISESSLDSLLPPPIPMSSILNNLQVLRNRFGFVTFITSWDLIPPAPAPTTPASKASPKYSSERSPGAGVAFYARRHPNSYPSPFAEHDPLALKTVTSRSGSNYTDHSPLPITHHITLIVEREPIEVEADVPNSPVVSRKTLAFVRTPVISQADLEALDLALTGEENIATLCDRPDRGQSAELASEVTKTARLRPCVVAGYFEFSVIQKGLQFHEHKVRI